MAKWLNKRTQVRACACVRRFLFEAEATRVSTLGHCATELSNIQKHLTFFLVDQGIT